MRWRLMTTSEEVQIILTLVSADVIAAAAFSPDLKRGELPVFTPRLKAEIHNYCVLQACLES